MAGISYQVIEHDIVAGGFQDIDLNSSFVRVLTSTAGGDNLQVELIGNNPQPRTPIYAGIAFLVADYKQTRLRFWNLSGATITVAVAISDSIIYDDRLTFTSALPIKGGTTRETVAASSVTTSAAVLVAQNDDRTSLLVQNNGTVDIWVGDSNVAVGRGTKVVAGAVFETASSAALYAIANGATNSSVNTHEEGTA